MRFLALGDSYTIGEGVAEHERWPSRLAALLRRAGVPVEDPQLVARTAWTTDELSDAIGAARPRGPFELVTLMVGVNDQYRGRDVASFAAEYTRLVEDAVRFAGGRAERVLAVSIPDWGATPFAEGRDRIAIGREVDAYNDRGATIARGLGVAWVDVTPASREMQHDPALVTADALHPSGDMHRRWAELLLPFATAALAAEPRPGLTRR